MDVATLTSLKGMVNREKRAFVGVKEGAGSEGWP